VTPCIWLGTTHPCNPPNYGLWVNLLFFMMCIYKHCFPPMLLVFAMKCCTKMPCPLPHNHYCCLLSSPMLASPAHLYMPHLFTHCLPTIICVMLMSIAFFFLFLIYAKFVGDSKKKKILKLDDVIDLSSLTDWCYNIHVTKY